jgi:hypothetical protein
VLNLNGAVLDTNEQISKILETFTNLVIDSQRDSGLITDDLKRFAADKGFTIKVPRSSLIKIELWDEVLSFLITMHSTIKPDKNPIDVIERMLISSLYFLEVDYDSPNLRDEDRLALKDTKNRFESNKMCLADNRINFIDQKMESRKKWMELRRKVSSLDFGYQDDRRDMHGILALNHVLNESIESDPNCRLIPFISEEFLLEQNRHGRSCKINSTLIISHLMYFLGIPKSEEAIRKLIKKYNEDVLRTGADYFPNQSALIWSERVLWEKIHLIERGKTISPLEDESINLEWLIYYFKRSSLVDRLLYVDKEHLAKIICEKCNIPFHPEESNLIITNFHISIDFRNG